MKLGLQLGYWGPLAPANHVDLAVKAEQLGYDICYSAESWGNDAFSPLAYIAAHTSKIRLGTSVAQLSARTPTACAMSTLTLDHLSKGRFVLGLGVSGPQVVEGWYGQPFSKPLARTREYVEIIRKVIAREEPVTNDGPHYPLPYHGEGAFGVGKSLKSITHPYRREIPIFIGAEGPKNVAQTFEIADGWIPLYYSPYNPEVYDEQAAKARPGFEIHVLAGVYINDDLKQALYATKAMLAFYIGGMGSRKNNFHADLMKRMGYEEEANRIQDLFLSGKRDLAIDVVPDEFADNISLSGPIDRIKERLQDWKKSPITTLLVNGDEKLLETMAELVL